MPFTFDSLEKAYKNHGDNLVILLDDGTVYSANPSDYWNVPNTHEFLGDLALRVPEHYDILHSYNKPDCESHMDNDKHILFTPDDNHEVNLTAAQAEILVNDDIIQKISKFEGNTDDEIGYTVCDEYAQDFTDCSGPFDFLG